MANWLRGVPKGSRGKYLERHSRGRGHVNKATRTLWRLHFTVQPPCHSSFFKNTSKTADRLCDVSTSVDSRARRLCTGKDSLGLFVLFCGSINYSKESSYCNASWTFGSIR